MFWDEGGVMTKKKDKVIYSITVSDIQEVADQELERALSLEEIELIRDRIAEKIPWYDAIAESIDELIVRRENQVQTSKLSDDEVLLKLKASFSV